MKQYNYLVIFTCAPSGIGNAHITRTNKIDNFDKLVELANWIGDKNNIKDVGIINFQLISTSRVKRRKNK